MKSVKESLDGAKFKEIREAYGLRQVAVANMATISRSRLSNFENGQIQISEDELRRVMIAIDSLIQERAEAGTLPIERDKEWSETAAWMKAKIKSAGIKQVEVAKELGVDPATVSLVLNGYQELSEVEQDRWLNVLEPLFAKQAEIEKNAAARASGYMSIMESMESYPNVLSRAEDLKARVAHLEKGIKIFEGGMAMYKREIAERDGRIAELEAEIAALKAKEAK